MRDPYETLGISPTAAADDIKTAYRKAARLSHPDRNPDPSAADRFRHIQAAYDIQRVGNVDRPSCGCYG